MKQYGPHAVVDLAKRMGIERKLLAVPSICLGTFDLSVYEMVGAYSVFVNEGIWNKPFYIEKISNKENIVIAGSHGKTTTTSLVTCITITGTNGKSTTCQLMYEVLLNQKFENFC